MEVIRRNRAQRSVGLLLRAYSKRKKDKARFNTPVGVLRSEFIDSITRIFDGRFHVVLKGCKHLYKLGSLCGTCGYVEDRHLIVLRGFTLQSVDEYLKHLTKLGGFK